MRNKPRAVSGRLLSGWALVFVVAAAAPWLGCEAAPRAVEPPAITDLTDPPGPAPVAVSAPPTDYAALPERFVGRRILDIPCDDLLPGDGRFDINIWHGDAIYLAGRFRFDPAVLSAAEPRDFAPEGPRAILPGDVVQVDIYELRIPEVMDVQIVRVMEDGTIRLAVVGQISADQRSAAQLADAIRSRLRKQDIIDRAGVRVTPRTYGGYELLGAHIDRHGASRQDGYIGLPRADTRLSDILAKHQIVLDSFSRVYVVRAP